MFIAWTVAICFVIIIVFSLWLIVEWTTHQSMTKDHSHTWGYGTYQNFVDQFEARKWYVHSNFSNSLFSTSIDNLENWLRYDAGELHASIIRFGDKGMVIRTPWAYFRVLIYKRQKLKELYSGNNEW